jgi:hypothetical protein
MEFCADWLIIFTACLGVIVIAAAGLLAAGGKEKKDDETDGS